MMQSLPRCASLIVAAGTGSRLGGLPKAYRLLGHQAMLAWSVQSLRSFGPVHVVIHPEHADLYALATQGLDLPAPIFGGPTRQASVYNGLQVLAAKANASQGAPDIVLIHDAARPFVPAPVVHRLLQALQHAPGAVPALPMVDSISLHEGDKMGAPVERATLMRLQTPQAFRFGEILQAHAHARQEANDDSALLQAHGLAVHLVEGDEQLFKITHAADWLRAQSHADTQQAALRQILAPRTGFGYDVHRFGPNADGSHDHIWLCGMKIAHDTGILAHSDGDVALHALTDALLGALGAGDIGVHFPPSDARWRGAPSQQFIQHAMDLLQQAQGQLVHIDITLVCERPKISPHRAAMRDRLSMLLKLAPNNISLKATTTEGLGFTGRREGIAAYAVATLLLPS
jgi:2-C-methyl-D-erythritol 4-phosphate cytidylyltransferase / 2-C-methyl-D-erythritol 2,4-cyclodiphosphate synthase